MVFIDLTKTFDIVDWEGIFHLLEKIRYSLQMYTTW